MPALISKRWMTNASSLLPVAMAAIAAGGLYIVSPSQSARYLVLSEAQKLLPLPANRVPRDEGQETVTIPPDRHGNFIVAAAINGVPIPMVFDTGASVVALSFEDAARAGLTPARGAFNRRIETASGVVMAAGIVISDFTLEGTVQNNVEAYILPPATLHTSLLGRSSWGRLAQGFSVVAGDLILKNAR